MAFYLILIIDKNVIQIYNNKYIRLFCQNLVDIVLESDWYIGQSKRYYLVLKMAIAGFKDRLLFIAFLDLHPMIGISKIELDKTSSSAELIQWFFN